MTTKEFKLDTPEDVDAWLSQELVKISEHKKWTDDTKAKKQKEALDKASQIKKAMDNSEGKKEKRQKEPDAPPAWFPKAHKFQPIFILEDEHSFTILGKEYKPHKFTVRETARLSKVIPGYVNYLGFDAFEDTMEDESIGATQIAKMITMVVNKAFDDYDMEQDCPSPFMMSVCDQIAKVIDPDNLTHQDIMNAGVDEVVDAVYKIWQVNYAFFYKIWRNSGIIQKTYTTISGAISNAFNVLNESVNKEQ